ncbi:class I tRNA ligase family protein [Saccharothrix syringae]|uniref:Methionine--tRNA ligase n=1 Tax=Saccharothrix syringae TaxID=103733 RepID=A0A5Q0HAA5_SACSY|nr:class I tRNA ligase family protein [Saccharothrix syringae]QFZ23178.1 methionine--tRNA ligase [Saccharothrix syringae]
MPRYYVTASHLDAVRADVLARHRRLRGDRVRFLLVSPDRDPRDLLALSSTDLAGADDPGHRVGVERLWRACAAAGDLRRAGEGWYFRLSRYGGRLRELVAGGGLRVEPVGSRDAVLALLGAGVVDVRADGPAGTGVPVPDDPGRVMAPWWDAAVGLTGLGNGPNPRRWWLEGDRRVHVVGADDLHRHALLWPAVLLSAGLPPPTDVCAHPTGPDLARQARRHGADAVRWWLLRDGTADDRVARLAAAELSGVLGDLVDRTTTMVHRYRGGRPPAAGLLPGADALLAACRDAPGRVDDALAAFDFRAATDAVWRVVVTARRYADQARPWDLARAERAGDRDAGERLDAVLAALLTACRALATELTPFLPTLAAGIAGQCITLTESLAAPRALFPRR